MSAYLTKIPRTTAYIEITVWLVSAYDSVYNAFQTKSGYSKLFFPAEFGEKREIADGPHISLKKAVCAEISAKNAIFQKT